jgi:hypothetical protein
MEYGMPIARRLAMMAAAGLILTTVGAGSSFAAAGAGSDYAQHVRMCQQAMGFSGTHNPGVMHQGFSGWDPDHTC